MTTVIKKLKAYGADVAGAMARFLDDEELYQECLNTFVEDPAFAALAQAVKSGQYPQAFDHAHALKGVSANLGLVPLYDAVCALWSHCAVASTPMPPPLLPPWKPSESACVVFCSNLWRNSCNKSPQRINSKPSRPHLQCRGGLLRRHLAAFPVSPDKKIPRQGPAGSPRCVGSGGTGRPFCLFNFIKNNLFQLPLRIPTG